MTRKEFADQFMRLVSEMTDESLKDIAYSAAPLMDVSGDEAVIAFFSVARYIARDIIADRKGSN